jgi:hypothetical protein
MGKHDLGYQLITSQSKHGSPHENNGIYKIHNLVTIMTTVIKTLRESNDLTEENASYGME